MWFKIMERVRKLINFGKVSDKYDILTVEKKRITLIVNKTKMSLEMTIRQRKLEQRRLKVSKIRKR